MQVMSGYSWARLHHDPFAPVTWVSTTATWVSSLAKWESTRETWESHRQVMSASTKAMLASMPGLWRQKKERLGRNEDCSCSEKLANIVER